MHPNRTSEPAECYRDARASDVLCIDTTNTAPRVVQVLVLDNHNRGEHLPVTYEPLAYAHALPATPSVHLDMYEVRTCTNCCESVPYRTLAPDFDEGAYRASFCPRCGAAFVF